MAGFRLHKLPYGVLPACSRVHEEGGQAHANFVWSQVTKYFVANRTKYVSARDPASSVFLLKNMTAASQIARRQSSLPALRNL